MARALVILVFLFGITTQSSALKSNQSSTLKPVQTNPFLGSWEFYKMLYKGNLLDPINPNFHMYFIFLDDQINSIIYYRDDQAGFCEREALYQYDESKKVLYQQVVWLNPKNADFCAQDPDMKFGSESWSGFARKGLDIGLEVPLSDETLTLLWRPVEMPVIPGRP